MIALTISFSALGNIGKPTSIIPRFATIKFNEVNARTGPAIDCPIEWVFISKGEPVEIVAEYEQWRKVRDIKEEGGWVHSSTLSTKRSVILISKNITPLISSPSNYDDVVVYLRPQIRCDWIKCKENWCKISCKTYKGWIVKNLLWGVHTKE